MDPLMLYTVSHRQDRPARKWTYLTELEVVVKSSFADIAHVGSIARFHGHRSCRAIGWSDTFPHSVFWKGRYS